MMSIDMAEGIKQEIDYYEVFEVTDPGPGETKYIWRSFKCFEKETDASDYKIKYDEILLEKLKKDHSWINMHTSYRVKHQILKLW